MSILTPPQAPPTLGESTGTASGAIRQVQCAVGARTHNLPYPHLFMLRVRASPNSHLRTGVPMLHNCSTFSSIPSPSSFYGILLYFTTKNY